MPQLIDTKPSDKFQVGEGWIFQFGEKVDGKRFGQVCLIKPTPCYRIFKAVLGKTGKLESVFETERDLTPEELAHFTRLAKEAEREINRALTRERRRGVEQHEQRNKLEQVQKAIGEATDNRVLN